MLSKNVNSKKCALISYSSMKKNQKHSNDFLHQFAKFNDFIWLQLLFSQKHFKFCTPTLKTTTYVGWSSSLPIKNFISCAIYVIKTSKKILLTDYIPVSTYMVPEFSELIFGVSNQVLWGTYRVAIPHF